MMQHRFRFGALAGLCLAVVAHAACAQTPPANVAAGQALADRFCSNCHVIAANGQGSWTDAPNFDVIANRDDVSAAKLSAFIQQPHLHMLNTGLLPVRDADAIAAYIVSLRRK
jgi:mono/diheme cytochrome c family protein